MSDPVSATEIEDVLTSIRRLVMENASVQSKTEAELPAKLVLTPAFRVDKDYEAAMASHQRDSKVVELSAAMRVHPSPATDEADEAPMVEIDLDAPVAPGSLESRIAELEAAVDESVVDFEPDGSEAPDIPERMILPSGEEDGDSEALADPQQDDAEADEVEETLEAEDAEPAPEEALVVEEPMTAERERIDPAEAETAELASDEADWEDVPPASNGHLHFQSEADEGAFLDEDALHEMVVQIVRDELKGPIGERITHNVRRMVRREIALALSLNDID